MIPVGWTYLNGAYQKYKNTSTGTTKMFECPAFGIKNNKPYLLLSSDYIQIPNNYYKNNLTIKSISINDNFIKNRDEQEPFLKCSIKDRLLSSEYEFKKFMKIINIEYEEGNFNNNKIFNSTLLNFKCNNSLIVNSVLSSSSYDSNFNTIVNSNAVVHGSGINNIFWNNTGQLDSPSGNAQSLIDAGNAYSLGYDNSLVKFLSTGHIDVQGIRDAETCPDPSYSSAFSAWMNNFGDFHLSSDSVLSGLGSYITSITCDLDGNYRNINPTIGAYEINPPQNIPEQTGEDPGTGGNEPGGEDPGSGGNEPNIIPQILHVQWNSEGPEMDATGIYNKTNNTSYTNIDISDWTIILDNGYWWICSYGNKLCNNGTGLTPVGEYPFKNEVGNSSFTVSNTFTMSVYTEGGSLQEHPNCIGVYNEISTGYYKNEYEYAVYVIDGYWKIVNLNTNESAATGPSESDGPLGDYLFLGTGITTFSFSLN